MAFKHSLGLFQLLCGLKQGEQGSSIGKTFSMDRCAWRGWDEQRDERFVKRGGAYNSVAGFRFAGDVNGGDFVSRKSAAIDL